jgi:hypothetical protein
MVRGRGRVCEETIADRPASGLEDTHLGQGPDSEVRIIVRRAGLPTSESKDTGNVLIQCGFGSEVRISDAPSE